MTTKTSSESVSPGEEVRLLDYLIILAKHGRLIIYTTALVAGLTLLILLVTPNRYTATSRILPPQQNLTLSAQLLDTMGGRGSTQPGAGSAMGGLAAGLLGFKSPGELYVGILTGNTVYDRITKRFHLREHYGKKYAEDVRSILSNMAIIKEGREGLITIAVTEKNPKLATEIANAFPEELDRVLQDMAHQEADQRLAFLEKEQNQASQNMFKAEEALKCYSEQSGVLQIDAQTKGVLEYIASLRAAIDSTEVKLLVMRQQATPYNYDLIRIETELNALKGKLRAAEEKSKDNSLCGESSIAKGEMPSLELEYLRLFRDVKFQDGLLQLYTRLVELARIDKARSAEIIHVVDKATVPGRKSSPKRLLTTVLVSMCTFFMMIFVAFIRERWQRMSAQPENAQRLTILMDYLEPWFRPFIHLFHSIRKKVKFKY